MADVYVRSAAAGTGTGASWANAYTTLSAAFAAKAAGDRFFVSEDHNETQASQMSLASPGTIAAPCQVYCVNHLGSVPPVAADLRTTAVVSTTGSSSILTAGYVAPMYGVNFSIGGGGANTASWSQALAAAPMYWRMERCLIELATTLNNGNASISFGLNAGTGVGFLHLYNSQVKFGSNFNQQIVALQGAKLIWEATAVPIAGTNFPSTLFGTNGNPGSPSEFELSALDFNGMTGTFYICFVGMVLRASRMNPGTGTIISGNNSNLFGRAEASSVSPTLLAGQDKSNYAGTLVQETAIVRAGGAFDGATLHSHKIVTTANATRQMPFEAIPLVIWNAVVGAPMIATVYGIWGGGAVPNNDDIWMEASYLGNAAYPAASVLSCGPPTPLSAGVGLPPDASTWGAGSTTKFAMSVTFTAQMKGPVELKIKAGKPSSTFYIDPKPVIAQSTAQAAAFLARTSGLDGLHAIAYAAFIDGLVRDGVWPKLDLLYILGTQSAAIARLNLMSSSFTMTEIGGPTFTPDQGYTGGVGKGLSTNWIPATHAVNYQLFNSSFGVRDNTSRGKDTVFPIGCNSSTMHFLNWCSVAANFLTRHDSSGEVAAINGGAGSKGFFVSNRTDSVNVEGFQDGVSIGAGTQHNAAGGFALATDVLMVLSTNSGTGITGVPAGETTDQLSVAFAGASMSAALQAAFAARIATLGATLGWP